VKKKEERKRKRNEREVVREEMKIEDYVQGRLDRQALCSSVLGSQS
jgi:hypothetical protein